MAKYKHNIDGEISLTYIVSSKKLTLVAALGVTIGIAIFVFMNSMTKGFSKRSDLMVFESYPHINIYKDDQMSQPLVQYPAHSRQLSIISNPKIVPETDHILDPEKVMDLLRKQKGVTIVAPQIPVSIFYNSGKSQIAGNTVGIDLDAANKMYDIQSTMIEGQMSDLKNIPNGILLGVGVAEKMNVRSGDIITVTSSKNVTKIMKVAGIFQTHISATDKTKSYTNINAAQQLLKEGPSYISNINVNVDDYNKAPEYAQHFAKMTGYTAEDWQTANATLVSAAKMRNMIVSAISMSILLVAGFGIYNILNMTINQKINEIAILKAMGFQGSDVIRIFVLQAFIIGLIGIVIGLGMATLFISWMSKMYVGGDIGYFPIAFEASMYLKGAVFGFIITLFAGYLPAKRAANVDPVEIFRK